MKKEKNKKEAKGPKKDKWPVFEDVSPGELSDEHARDLLPFLLRFEDKNIKIVSEKDTVTAIELIDEMQWVDIPAGTFIMGSPSNEVERSDDETQHQVSLNAFKMSKYAVTFEQYDIFCDATGSGRPSDEGWGRGKRPVINVDWNNATAFAECMGFRLPTEAEWEYACRAGTTTAFNTGNNLTTAQANYNGDYPYSTNAKGKYREKTLPVGSFTPNAWGLYDMHGNIWEWCSDWYGRRYSKRAQTNPKGPLSGSERVCRGGSWLMNAGLCRSAERDSNNPESYSDNLGFRLVSSK